MRKRFFKWTLFVLLLALLLIVGILLLSQDPPLPPGSKASQLLVYKSKRVMHLYQGTTLLKTYRVSLGDAPEGHKQQEGDERTPEGRYYIDWRNPNSVCYLSLHISYPNKKDKQQAAARKVSPGGDIMIHGMLNGWGWLGRLHRFKDWTNGCIAVTDEEMDELWKAVPNGTPIEIYP